VAGTAISHQGVENAAVQARMHNMMEIVDDLKVMGDMAKGQTAFDAEAAQAAAKDIARHAAETPSFFAMNETDPKSEAKPIIWDQFGDFTAKSRSLEAVALDVSASLTDLDNLKQGMSQIAQTCKDCHGVYRE
jgi:cytochrome c556